MSPYDSDFAFQFGTWIVEPHLNRIRQRDEAIQLEPRTTEVLTCLLGNPGQIVSIDQLMDEVWKDRVVEPNAVHRNMTRIRRALGDDSKNPQYIETISKRGYRTKAPVKRIPAADTDDAEKADLASVTPPYPAYDGEEPYIFVCYSHADREPVYRELLRLRDAGVNVWYDEGIPPGSEWEEEIAAAINQCAHFLYFVSPRSVTSRFCLNELQLAQSRERSVVVVHLEPTTLPNALQLSMGRLQALFKYLMRDTEYARKLLARLSESPSPSLEAEYFQPPAKPVTRRWKLTLALSASFVVAVALFLGWLRSSEAPPNSVAVGRFEDLAPSFNQPQVGASLVSEVRVALPVAGLQGGGLQSQR